MVYLDRVGQGKKEPRHKTFRAWNKEYRLQRVNQIGLYKTLIKRWIFHDSEIRLSGC